MSTAPEWIPQSWLWGATLVLGVIWVASLRARPWLWLATGSRVHAFYGAILACMVLWSIAGKLGQGPSFHLLGTTVLTLMFGPRLALAAVTLALAGVAVTDVSRWQWIGLNGILMGAVPIVVSYAFHRTVERRLPNHFFVFVFVSAFVNGALAMVVSRLVTLCLWWSAAPPGATMGWHDALLATLLLSWGEALTSGMLLTVFVIYRPDWVRLFDDRRYLVGH